VKKKISTAEHAETAERFLPKEEKHESFYESFIPSASSRISAVCGSFLLLENENLSFSSSSEDQDKRMTEEEAESAETLL
jgi:hypothetical protein